MKLQPTLLQARGYGSPNSLGFRLCPAMHDGVSSPREFHPRALAEPDLNLSAHPAPITPLRRTTLYRPAPPITGWPIDKTEWLHPFAPSALPDFLTTTGESAPVHRFRTLALVVLPLELLR